MQADLSDEQDTALRAVIITADIESLWKALLEAIHASSLVVLGLPLRKHQDLFDENDTEIKKLIDEMHKYHKIWANNKNCQSKQAKYKGCQARVQLAPRQMIWWSDKSAQFQMAADKRDSKAFYDGLKAVYGPQKHDVSPILANDGDTLLTDKKAILQRWRDHFETVLNSNSVTDDESLPAVTHAEISVLSLEPAFLEVKDSIKQILPEKLPGEDDIPVEIYKHRGHKLCKLLHDLFIQIWRSGHVPQDSNNASVQNLYKKKDLKTVCDDHRGI